MSPGAVITGIGVLTCRGAGPGRFDACASRAPEDGLEGAPGPAVGEGGAAAGGDDLPGALRVGDLDLEEWLGPRGNRALDRAARLLAVSVGMALRHAGLPTTESDPTRLGLVCGTQLGGIDSIVSFDSSILERGPRLVSPMLFAGTVINAAAGQTAIKHGLRGINSTVSAGHASALVALDRVVLQVGLDRADALVCAGLEVDCEARRRGYAASGMLSPSGRARPFAGDSDGTVVGEAAVAVTVETRRRARARGAPILGEVMSTATGRVATAPAAQAARRRVDAGVECLRRAMEAAGIGVGDVDVVVADASGVPALDRIERQVLKRLLGDRLERVDLCFPKAACGETGGASGLVALVRAIGELGRRSAGHALVYNLGCGGNNAAAVVRLGCAS